MKTANLQRVLQWPLTWCTPTKAQAEMGAGTLGTFRFLALAPCCNHAAAEAKS